jgi:hypothetical protein
MATFRLPRFRTEPVTDKPGSRIFRQWWDSVMTRIEDNDTEIRADIATLEQTVTDNSIDADSRYVRGDGSISAAAAKASTHQLAWTDPQTGTVYYILMSNV